MRQAEKIEPWVVYKKTIPGKLSGSIAVCAQSEWDALQLSQPGEHTLIREGIINEGEAEKLAREAPGGTSDPVRLKRR